MFLQTRNIQESVNLLVIYTAVPAVFVTFFLHLELFTELLRNSPESAFFIGRTAEFLGTKLIRRATDRSFLIIALFAAAATPVIRTLTSGISSDTIWTHFAVCQIIYSIWSVRASVLQRVHKKKTFPRNYVIPLEESLLLTSNSGLGHEIASISAIGGFILILSRVRESFEAILLQLTGLVLYFIVPRAIITARIHHSTFKTLFLMVLVTSILGHISPLPAIVFFSVTMLSQLVLKLLTYVKL